MQRRGRWTPGAPGNDKAKLLVKTREVEVLNKRLSDTEAGRAHLQVLLQQAEKKLKSTKTRVDKKVSVLCARVAMLQLHSIVQGTQLAGGMALIGGMARVQGALALSGFFWARSYHTQVTIAPLHC
jgi:hypothetical protein